MTALTPQQMRELALDAVMAAENADRRAQTGHALRYRKMAAALRTAADQIEAVQAERDAAIEQAVETAQLLGLTADTTPQEDRDE